MNEKYRNDYDDTPKETTMYEDGLVVCPYCELLTSAPLCDHCERDFSEELDEETVERLEKHEADELSKIDDKTTMLLVFKSCIATQTMPAIDSPCHEQIKKLLKS